MYSANMCEEYVYNILYIQVGFLAELQDSKVEVTSDYDPGTCCKSRFPVRYATCATCTRPYSPALGLV